MKDPAFSPSKDRPWLSLLITACFALVAGAAAGVSPKLTLYPPVTGEQAGDRGGPVAVDGNITVVGNPSASLKGRYAGVVKVYDTASGNLIRLLTNPRPGTTNFGDCVAVSGTRIAVSNGATVVYVFDLASSNPQLPVRTIRKPPGRENMGFGQPLAFSGKHLAISSVHPNLAPVAGGVVYVHNLEGPAPAVPVMTLQGPVSATQDDFGRSIAISCDRLVVGVPLLNGSKGAAFVYDLAGATPAPALELRPPVGANAAQFGYVVDIDGDRVAVGEPFDRPVSGGTGRGRVYLHDLAATNPSIPTGVIVDPMTLEDSRFGRLLALSGERLAVTANHVTTNPRYSGRVEVYDLSAPATVPLTLKPAVPSSRSFYGDALDLSGARLVVQGYGQIEGFDLASSTPGSVAQIYRHALPGIEDRAGQVVAVSGSRVAVASRDGTYPQEPRVLVYDLASATPQTPLFTLQAEYSAYGTHWGIAMEGDRMVVTTYGQENAKVYDLSSATPSAPVLVIDAPSAWTATPAFGNAMSLSGGKLAIGAPTWTNTTQMSEIGRVYLYDLDGLEPATPVQVLENPAPWHDDSFGRNVALSGSRVLVSADAGPSGLYSQGIAYLFDLSGEAPGTPVHTFQPETPEKFGYFASGLALEGNRAVLSEPSRDRVHVYDLSGPVPLALHTLSRIPEAIEAAFGSSISLSGGRLVVGESTGASWSAAGKAWLYDLSQADPSVGVVELHGASPGAFREFGSYVAIDGDVLVVGAPGDDSITFDNGAADVFDLSAGPNPCFALWAAQSALSGDDAEEDAAPAGDGMANLLKYAFNLPADGGHQILTPGIGTSGLPVTGLTAEGGEMVFRMEYLRRKNSNVIYTPVLSTGLGGEGSSTIPELTLVIDIDAQWERAIVEHPVEPGTQPSLFGWVEVNSP